VSLKPAWVTQQHCLQKKEKNKERKEDGREGEREQKTFLGSKLLCGALELYFLNSCRLIKITIYFYTFAYFLCFATV
jgi:hypothetical protein